MIRPLILSLALLASPAAAVETEAAQGALLRALDKVAGTTTDLDVDTGGEQGFGHIKVRVSECRYPSGDANSDAFVHLTITDDKSPKPLFDGWMMASSPALSALDHPRYDVWVIRCRIS
ncbi:DUF2155 domain-containing protein [Paracoccus sp. p4-l81]|uniref:DUF2155 domain-containing protein n=1 Tax=Paracoccus sp. p4-l81 TaxID=3342806 RepID=UPI0035B88282